MMSRYRLDNKTSRFTVKAFATGLLSFAAHSPTFLVTDVRGGIDVEANDLNRMRVEVTVNADSLEIIDDVSAADRQEIEGRMRREVLETGRYRGDRVPVDRGIGQPDRAGPASHSHDRSLMSTRSHASLSG